MVLNVRRVVTGHDENGKAVVKIDEIAGYARSRRPGHSAFVAWATDKQPIDNADPEDGRFKQVTNGTPGSTILRIVEYGPGVSSRRHRTNSIDYAIVMSGEIDMELDEGEVHLKAGDVLVQRGTIHNWVNRGTEPCVIAFCLIAASPVLDAEG
jgi:quercetin dioxygenase-like cupin family protein